MNGLVGYLVQLNANTLASSCAYLTVLIWNLTTSSLKFILTRTCQSGVWPRTDHIEYLSERVLGYNHQIVEHHKWTIDKNSPETHGPYLLFLRFNWKWTKPSEWLWRWSNHSKMGLVRGRIVEYNLDNSLITSLSIIYLGKQQARNEDFRIDFTSRRFTLSF
jgi:hypothetical protein